MSGIKLSAISANDTAVLELRDGSDNPLTYTAPDGTEKPVTITLYGPGSKKWQAAKSASDARQVNRLKKKGSYDMSSEERLKEVANHLADITESMDGIDGEGKTGRDLFVSVYADPTVGFIAQQANTFSADWANFSKGSKTT